MQPNEGNAIEAIVQEYQVGQFSKRLVASERLSQRDHLQLLEELLGLLEAALVVERHDAGVSVHLKKYRFNWIIQLGPIVMEWVHLLTTWVYNH